jgi:uncharacterized protein (DUF362 family)
MTHSNTNTWKLVAALQVIALDPAIARFLQKTDPQALKQVQEALRDHFNQFEDATHFSDFELR